MKRTLLICIGILPLTLTAAAQMPNNQRKVQQRTPTHRAYRSTSTVRHMPAQHTFSNAPFRQPASSIARRRDSIPRSTRVQPRMSSSFLTRSAMTRSRTSGRVHPAVTNDWRDSKFTPRARPTGSLANRPLMRDDVRRQSQVADTSRWEDAGFRQRPRARSSFANRSMGNDAFARRQVHHSFNDYWANANGRDQSRTNRSFMNGSRNAAFWGGPRRGLTTNWRSAEFAGRQYLAFRNYQSQWHDSGWWHDHCDRIIFVTVYSEPFPFYFDAGYWYPAWGYFTDAYYPYDGPIYGYDDLPPDEVIANVQTQLYSEGYYDGPIDGILGPDTQAAIADYQADRGLAVTAGIDEPTVVSLGLV